MVFSEGVCTKWVGDGLVGGGSFVLVFGHGLYRFDIGAGSLVRIIVIL